MSAVHVAVIGGGYSGTLQAIQLLRRGARVMLVERAERLGRGIAYSTRHPDHLLNVRAARMSAFPDEPDHFADWLAKGAGGGPADFAERSLYGSYLRELLDRALAEYGDDFRIVSGEAVDVMDSAPGEAVRLRSGEVVNADQVILALGNLEPELPNGVPPELAASGAYIADPWAGDLAEGLGGDDRVLLIGTGLTAVDAALTLDDAGFSGPILAISRRGLVPRAHSESPSDVPDMGAAAHLKGSKLVRFVRDEARRIGWHSAVDQLRPLTQILWAEATLAERRRFLRHLRPWWDVHRHRIAPAIAERIDGMRRGGRLRFEAGKIVSISAAGSGAEVQWRRRGTEEVERVVVSRIVNCTGPNMNIADSGEELLGRLIERGRIRPDPCGIGIDVDGDWRTLDRSGEASATLYAIGPLTRGAVWEIVAVPDIRSQVQSLAMRLAG